MAPMAAYQACVVGADRQRRSPRGVQKKPIELHCGRKLVKSGFGSGGDEECLWVAMTTSTVRGSSPWVPRRGLPKAGCEA